MLILRPVGLELDGVLEPEPNPVLIPDEVLGLILGPGYCPASASKAQVAPLVHTDGRPNKGINVAVRDLGIDRSEAQRAVKIAKGARVAADAAGYRPGLGTRAHDGPWVVAARVKCNSATKLSGR